MMLLELVEDLQAGEPEGSNEVVGKKFPNFPACS
jgi:hypothetical protein